VALERFEVSLETLHANLGQASGHSRECNEQRIAHVLAPETVYVRNRLDNRAGYSPTMSQHVA
jgi:hypothetical protein